MLLRFFLLVSLLGVEGCGPARGGPHRQRFKKLTPLVFKQHEPNIDEKSIQASGLFESKIEKGSTRFKDLVLNYNPDIIFKDEEGTGADRLMTQRCMEKVNHLAISVMNTWPGVQLRVTEGWDGDNEHPGDSLHYEGRAVDITTSDKDKAKLGMLARLAVEAGFDWVYYETRSHIHCSVKSDRNILLRSGGCFKGDSTVETRDGVKKPLAELQIGEQILAYEPRSGKLVFSEVIFFLDRNPNATSTFMKMRTSSGKELTLTPTHLLPRRRAHNDQLETVFAARLSPDDQVLVSQNGVATLEKVESVEVTEQSGTYAPLTRVGTLLVDGVVASCYAVLESQSVAHYSFLPARLVSSGRDILHYAYNYFTGSSMKETYIPDQHGVHWYTSFLNKTVSYILPSSFVYASYT